MRGTRTFEEWADSWKFDMRQPACKGSEFAENVNAFIEDLKKDAGEHGFLGAVAVSDCPDCGGTMECPESACHNGEWWKTDEGPSGPCHVCGGSGLCPTCGKHHLTLVSRAAWERTVCAHMGFPRLETRAEAEAMWPGPTGDGIDEPVEEPPPFDDMWAEAEDDVAGLVGKLHGAGVERVEWTGYYSTAHGDEEPFLQDDEDAVGWPGLKDGQRIALLKEVA